MPLRHWNHVGGRANGILSEFPIAALSEIEVFFRNEAFIAKYPSWDWPRSADESGLSFFQFPPIVSWMLPASILPSLIEINILTPLGHGPHDNFQERSFGHVLWAKIIDALEE